MLYYINIIQYYILETKGMLITKNFIYRFMLRCFWLAEMQNCYYKVNIIHANVTHSLK